MDNLKKRRSRRNSSLERKGSRKTSRDPEVVYRDLVSHSSTHFRADVEFHEQPRQIIFGFLLVLAVTSLGAWNSDSSGDLPSACRLVLLGILAFLVIYCSLQTKDGLMV
jgi:hypothetical protein